MVANAVANAVANLVVSADQMASIEKATFDSGVSSAAVMENAGAAVAALAMKAWTKRPVLVVCGPGNNGGDGFVAARLLAEAGWPVTVSMVADKASLKGDAKLMAGLYQGDVTAFSGDQLRGAELVIDAVFGTGLTRPIEDELAGVIAAINASRLPVLAVDLPSGVHADTGAEMGVAVRAARTLTFFAKKPGHLLFPGRALCGAVDVAEIGIPAEIIANTDFTLFENQPPVWGGAFPRPDWPDHKYKRGHVFVLAGGPLRTGAARLAADGAQRIGAGLTTLLAEREAALVIAHHVTAAMVRDLDGPQSLSDILGDKDQYPRAIVIGPGAGIGEATRKGVLASASSSASLVVDADGLTSFSDDPDALFSALGEDDVITPHAGEFKTLFGEAGSDDRLETTRAAARQCGCTVIFKGADTIIAAADGRAMINANAPPDLATAGAGDVLCGFVAGLKAQGMPGFGAACAAVWFHGAAAQAAGPGMIAEDLPRIVPSVLRALLSPPQQADNQA